MLGALLASLSRSGLLGAATGLLVMLGLGRRRMSKASAAWILGAVVASIAAATAYANVSAIAGRLGEAMSTQLGGRVLVWRETWPMVRDFPATGIGVGAFERGMSLYQQSTRLLFFNHAHNEYLQILVEGGLLLAIPVAVGIAAVILEAGVRLKADRSPAFWLRVGATSSLCAVAVQSVWDTGLRMPANAVLFAIAAAMTTYDSAGRK
jgi:O-antigen ligase